MSSRRHPTDPAALWTWRGQGRPDWAEPTGPGQESVWDYPRPPRLEPVDELVRIELGGVEVVRTRDAVRVCETASPPTYYVPRAAVRGAVLEPAPGTSVCEWKGVARYWDAVVGAQRFRSVAWEYTTPQPPFESLAGRLAFYPARVDGAWVGDARALAQEGGFYGGWVLPHLRGPWKGGPGTGGW